MLLTEHDKSVIKSWIIYVLWLAAALLLNIFSSSAASFLFLCLSVIIPMLAAAFHRLAKSEIDINISLPDSVEKGETAIGEIHISNRKKLPCILVAFDIKGENLLTGEYKNFKGKCSLLSKTQSKINLKIKDNYCGKIVFSAEKVKVFDSFGLTYKKIHPSVNGSINVLPEISALHINVNGINGEDVNATDYSHSKPGFDLSEPYEYREYEMGDSPKSVHWKLSQKLDKLIIRQGGLPSPRSILIMLDTCINKNNDYPDYKKLSQTAELFISAGKSLCDMQIAHTICFYDHKNHELFSCLISTYEDWLNVVPKILSAQFSSDEKSCFEYYAEYAHKSFEHILCISPCNNKYPQFENTCVTVLKVDETKENCINI